MKILSKNDIIPITNDEWVFDRISFSNNKIYYDLIYWPMNCHAKYIQTEEIKDETNNI